LKRFLKRFFDLAIDDFARLKRFRRVAMNHDIALPETGMLVEREIEHLREQLNASVYLEAEPWMLPSWVDLTMKGLDKEETLVSELPNNTYRNWSLIGGVGSRKFGITDSRGLVTASPGCGSVDIWVLDPKGIIFPALMGKDEPQLKLVAPADQLYEWRTDVQSIEFTRLLYHVQQDGVEYLFNEVILKNIALEETSLTFYAVLRPMSVLGFEPIETLEFDAKSNQVVANDSIALQVDISPSAVYLVEANDATIPVVIQSDETRLDYKASSKEGLGTAVLRFDIGLAPAGTRTIVFASPLETPPEDESTAMVKLSSHNRDLSIGNWYDFTEKRGLARFPDEKLNNVLSQAAASLAIQAQSVLFPEESKNGSLNWRDRMRILYALIKSGGVDVASQITNQAAHIYVESKVSMDTSIFSPILWGLLQLQGYSIQKESIQENIEYLAQLAEGLVTALEVDRPRKKAIEHASDEFDELEDAPLTHYRVLDDSILQELNELLWDLSALRESQSYFTLTQVDLVAKIKDTIPLIEERIRVKLDEIMSARWPRSNDPQMVEIDRAILDILTSIVQLKIHDLDIKILRDLCKQISSRQLVRNLWKTQESAESLSSHLALRIAQFHVWDKQRDAAEPLLRRALEFLSEDFLLPEFVNPRTFGGSGGAGSSVLAAADIVLLLSEMLVQEEENNLVFLAGVPSEWFTAKKPLTIKGLHTKFGKTSIDIGLSANQHQIETGMEILPHEIEIHVPESVPLRMVKAYGGSIVERAVKDRSPHIKLVPLSNGVVLTYHR
jgi:hypothetical protein